MSPYDHFRSTGTYIYSSSTWPFPAQIVAVPCTIVAKFEIVFSSHMHKRWNWECNQALWLWEPCAQPIDKIAIQIKISLHFVPDFYKQEKSHLWVNSREQRIYLSRAVDAYYFHTYITERASEVILARRWRFTQSQPSPLASKIISSTFHGAHNY